LTGGSSVLKNHFKIPSRKEMLVRKVVSLLCFVSVIALAFMVTLALNPPTAYAQAKKDLVDLNKASEKELESLKGVGPPTA
jgi:DNA uptake protein ComE-like DNA-binding protein